MVLEFVPWQGNEIACAIAGLRPLNLSFLNMPWALGIWSVLLVALAPTLVRRRRSDAVPWKCRAREREPDRSIYNWLCEQEWAQPPGEVRAFGGIVMMRISAVTAVGGYREDLIAGEEPELGVRLRLAGWRLWRSPS